MPGTAAMRTSAIGTANAVPMIYAAAVIASVSGIPSSRIGSSPMTVPNSSTNDLFLTIWRVQLTGFSPVKSQCHRTDLKVMLDGGIGKIEIVRCDCFVHAPMGLPCFAATLCRKVVFGCFDLKIEEGLQNIPEHGVLSRGGDREVKFAIESLRLRVCCRQRIGARQDFAKFGESILAAPLCSQPNDLRLDQTARFPHIANTKVMHRHRDHCGIEKQVCPAEWQYYASAAMTRLKNVQCFESLYGFAHDREADTE